LKKNLALLPRYNAIAAEVGCTPAQLAIAWLLHQGAHIHPIPGTTRVAHVHENARADEVHLSADVLSRLDSLINQSTVTGNRYDAQAQSEVDTEFFA